MMRVIMLKLVRCEKVTDDLMLAALPQKSGHLAEVYIISSLLPPPAPHLFSCSLIILKLPKFLSLFLGFEREKNGTYDTILPQYQ